MAENNIEQQVQVQNVINKKCYIEQQLNTVNNYYYEKQKRKSNVIFQVPNPVDSFCGREDELKRIDDLFEQSNIVVISGMGGIGKTELCKNYIKNYGDKYQKNLIWINGETKETLKTSFQGVGSLLEINTNQDLKVTIQLVYSYFENCTVLFVFDNVDNRNSIREYFPSKIAHENVNTFLLITSQNNDWGDIQTIPVTILCAESSLEVFKAILGPRYQQADEEHWAELAETLNYIPLALQIAGSHINEEMRSYESVEQSFQVEAYVKKLQGEDKLLEESFPENSDNDYTKNIYSAVKISIEKIENIKSTESVLALDVLYLSSYLDASEIDYEVFLPVSISEDVLHKICAILVKFSLITIRTERYSLHYGMGRVYKYINIHRLLQWILRYHQELNNTKTKYYPMILDLLPATSLLDREYHLESIYKHGECITNICSEYYFKKKPENYLQKAIRFKCIAILKKIFESMNRLKAIWVIRSKQLLLTAIQSGDLTTFNYLYQYGYHDINKKYHDWTLLHFACNIVHPDKIKRLIELGALANITEEKGLTPLHLICGARWIWEQQHEDEIIECIQLLITKAKADINALAKNKNSALYYASSWLLPKVSEWLVKRSQLHINIIDIYDETLLSSLCRKTVLDQQSAQTLIQIATTLISHGADYKNFRSVYKNKNLFHLSLQSKNVLVVKWMIEELKMDINSLDALKDSALHMLAYTACYSNQENRNLVEIFKYLVANGARLDIENAEGVSAMQAIENSQNKFVLEHLP